MPKELLAILGIVSALLVPASGAAQRQPNFSGHWMLVEALSTGATRASSGTPAPGGVPTRSNTIGGAAVNCGRECTIVHKGQMLTIDNAQLADFAGKDKSRRTPAVTFQLDGRRASVVDSFSPSRELSVTAKWNGDKLEVTTGEERLVHKQLLSLEEAQLVVVSVTSLNGERRSELTFKYKKK
jgi:hypothetical protein